jgi:hypothetical protein
MIHLLLFKYGGSQDYAFASLLDSRPQKKRAQVLFHSARADAEFRSDFFITAALNQQAKNLLVAAGDFDLIEVQHFFFLFFLLECQRFLIEARLSPKLRRLTIPLKTTQMQHLRIPTAA